MKKTKELENLLSTEKNVEKVLIPIYHKYREIIFEGERKEHCCIIRTIAGNYITSPDISNTKLKLYVAALYEYIKGGHSRLNLDM